MKNYFIAGLFLLILGCEKNETSEKGTLSFGTNTGLLNCIVYSKVIVDNKEMGYIPGYCDTIIDCTGESTLNFELSTGQHNYKIELSSQTGNCFSQKTGNFILEKDECEKIFYDITIHNDK